MSIVNTLALESNRQIKINFDGGDLSSDAGLLLIKEFVSKLGIDKLFVKSFKTNDSALFRYHTDQENLLQMIYMIIAGYFEDDTSDELTNDPVFKSVLEKDALASQPTVSRFFNRMDEDTLNQFLAINRVLRKKIYSIQIHVKPKKRVHTYWFTDYRKAKVFLESVKVHPKVLDYGMFSMEADVFEEYKEDTEDPLIQMDESNRNG